MFGPHLRTNHPLMACARVPLARTNTVSVTADDFHVTPTKWRKRRSTTANMSRRAGRYGAKVAVVDLICMEGWGTVPLASDGALYKFANFRPFSPILSFRTRLNLISTTQFTMSNQTTPFNENPPPDQTTLSDHPTLQRSRTSRPSMFQATMIAPMLNRDAPPYRLPGTGPGESEFWGIRENPATPLCSWPPPPPPLSSTFQLSVLC